MNLREIALLAAILLTAIPAGAGYIRHRAGITWVIIVGNALLWIAFLAVLWRLVSLERSIEALPWVWGLALLGVPLLLGGYLFTALVGRDDPRQALKHLLLPFSFLALLGVAVLIAAAGERFIVDYRWRSGTGVLAFGPFGKAYLAYLLLGTAFIGQNLERAYRTARREARPGFHPMILGHFGVVGFGVYVLTTGLAAGHLDLDTLVALVLPLALADLLTGYGFLRGNLVDRAVPVSRSVVYTSFTAVAAAIYFIAMGVASELVTLTGWTPGHVITASFVFFVLLTASLFLFSDRVRDRVRRFVDLNFYVHRHDYRSHWARLTREFEPSRGTEALLPAAEEHLRDVFQAQGATLALRERSSRGFRVRQGKGRGTEGGTLPEASTLVEALRDGRRAVLLRDRRSLAEAEPLWFRDTASQVVAPLLAGDELFGVIGLERAEDDPFRAEDLELLDYTAGQLAAVLRGAEWGTELAAMRETELLSQWSGMVVHDLKNHLSPLRMIVRNMRGRLDNPAFLGEAVEDLAAVTAQMERLMSRLGGLRSGTAFARHAVELAPLCRDVLADLRADSHPSLTVTTDLGDLTVAGDATMIRRVVENFVTNAVEAMDGKGSLAVAVKEIPPVPGEPARAAVEVRDSGPGMDPGFVSERLFRPFATTKRTGLGLGLYQCRLIVEAHGGEIRVESAPGRGTTMTAFFSEVMNEGVEPPPAALVATGIEGRAQ